MKKTILAVSLAALAAGLLWPAEKSLAFSFAVIGDTQKFNAGKIRGSLRRSLSKVNQADVDLIFAMGDFCRGNNCEKRLIKWKRIAGNLFTKVYPVKGNHDAVSQEFWQSFFNTPLNGPDDYVGTAYSFDFDNSHFVVLNTEKPAQHSMDAAQRSWLEQDLLTSTKDHTFVFFHEPAFPVSSKIGESLDANPTDRDALWQILDTYGVDGVFNGHEHIACRRLIDSSIFPQAQGLVFQFIVGNTDSFAHRKPRAGTVQFYTRKKSIAVVEVEDNTITVDTYSVGGRLLDSYSFMHQVVRI